MKASRENSSGFSTNPSTSNFQVARSTAKQQRTERFIGPLQHDGIYFGPDRRGAGTAAEHRQLSENRAGGRFSQNQVFAAALDEHFEFSRQDQQDEIGRIAFFQ